MPNYKYRCQECDEVETMSLSMSYDPSAEFMCSSCGGMMNRIMSAPRVITERETLGKWYKENTGKDLLGD